jgi:8-oxo-dGTP diphosphatase
VGQIRERVVAYITWGERLLVFRHTRFPEAGIQVPGGSVEPGEDPHQAVLREAREETGLQDFEVCAYLGSRAYDLALWGGSGIQQRRYYHLVLHGQAPERWVHYEHTPSDGSPGPIELEFYWVTFPEQVPELAGQQGDLLYKLALGGRPASFL